MKTTQGKPGQGISVFFGLCGSMALLAGCSEKQEDPVVEGWERVRVDFPPPMAEGTPFPMPRLPVPFDLHPKVPPVGIAPTGWTNLALHRPITSSDPKPIIGSLALVSDGEKSINGGYHVELMNGLQWVQVDLEEEAAIYLIWLWHHAGLDNLVYHDVVVEISNDPEFKTGVTQIFNNDYDNSSGRGRGMDSPYLESNYGKPIQINGVPGRYVRCYSNGCNISSWNRYVEIEIYGVPSSAEIAVMPEAPTDPMSASPEFKAFETAFWDLVNGPQGGALVDMWIEQEGLLVVTTHRWWRTPESRYAAAQRKRLEEIVEAVRSLRSRHMYETSLQAIEVRGLDGSVIMKR